MTILTWCTTSRLAPARVLTSVSGGILGVQRSLTVCTHSLVQLGVCRCAFPEALIVSDGWGSERVSGGKQVSSTQCLQGAAPSLWLTIEPYNITHTMSKYHLQITPPWWSVITIITKAYFYTGRNHSHQVLWGIRLRQCYKYSINKYPTLYKYV